MQLPPYDPERDYRRDHDGDDPFLSPSTRTSLCLFCGVWYGWEEVHGQILGGCYPPPLPEPEEVDAGMSETFGGTL